MKIIIGMLMITASFSTYAKSYTDNCFSDHIKESIVINKERKPFYSKLTNGRSNKVFNFLITSETLTLPLAKIYDFRARKYQKNGVPLFCYEFMSMDATPRFDLEKRVIPTEEFEEFDWKSYKKRIDVAVKAKDAEAIKEISYEALTALKAYPHYYCMLRHLFESIYRFAYFMPLQVEAAEKAGLKSPAKLSMNVIKMQLLALISANKIDQWSAPIQKEGIPLLCSELPLLLEDLPL